MFSDPLPPWALDRPQGAPQLQEEPARLLEASTPPAYLSPPSVIAPEAQRGSPVHRCENVHRCSQRPGTHRTAQVSSPHPGSLLH